VSPWKFYLYYIQLVSWLYFLKCVIDFHNTPEPIKLLESTQSTSWPITPWANSVSFLGNILFIGGKIKYFLYLPTHRSNCWVGKGKQATFQFRLAVQCKYKAKYEKNTKQQTDCQISRTTYTCCRTDKKIYIVWLI
jgi:hypothetical protein